MHYSIYPVIKLLSCAIIFGVVCFGIVVVEISFECSLKPRGLKIAPGAKLRCDEFLVVQNVVLKLLTT